MVYRDLYLKMELGTGKMISFFEPFAKGVISGVPGRPKGRPGTTGELVKRGFIVANVEYRRGRVLDPNPNLYNSVQQALASYRASQDVRGAIRSII